MAPFASTVLSSSQLQSGTSRLPRQATKGFGAAKPKRKRPAISLEQLRTDHGEKAEAVQEVLTGKPASCPEDMVRARFSAVRAKDVVFMARSEKDEGRPKVDDREHGWAVVFGLEDDADPGISQALRTCKGFELVSVDGNEVEFKIDCGDNGVLHERSVMVEHKKFGHIYSGDSIFSNWL